MSNYAGFPTPPHRFRLQSGFQCLKGVGRSTEEVGMTDEEALLVVVVPDGRVGAAGVAAGGCRPRPAGSIQGVDRCYPEGRGDAAALGSACSAIGGGADASGTAGAAGATIEQVTMLLDALYAVCRPVEISFLWRPMLRDADDEMLVEVAVNGRADRLLTFNERDFAGAGRLGVTVERPRPAWRSWRKG